MQLLDYVILGVIAVAVLLAVRNIRKGGGCCSGCKGNCGSCSSKK